MCGFVAWIGRSQQADKEAIDRMLGVIHHRGPDDRGVYFSGAVGFGFRRLAILDLSPAGHQPMSTLDGRYTIVFNGEIYNYIEIRKELLALGHLFISNSDTEVLLHAYVEWGEACLGKLNGMWAFLIHDRAAQTVFGARDRFGMKPLYYHKSNEAVLFASEIKSIRVSGYYKELINTQVCASFFYEQQLDETDNTFFSGISSIPAAHSFVVNALGEIRISRYWEAPQEMRVEHPDEIFADLFESAVGIHLRSDVPVGVNLSGGLDSTAIICSIARHRAQAGNKLPLQAFCYSAKEFDESAYVSATLAQTGAVSRPLELGARELWGSLPRVLWFQDEPVHSITAVVGFHLSALAVANGVKVVLNGQGADETLGGYPSYFRDYWVSIFLRDGYSALVKQIKSYCVVQGGDSSRLVRGVLIHCAKSGLRHLMVYRRAARANQLRRFAEDDWFEPELVKSLPSEMDQEGIDLRSSLQRAVTRAPLPLYLRVEDRNSMAHSVESRLPFLDARVVDFAYALPPEWKLRGPWNKHVLREGMRNRIPEIVRVRPDKMGFPTPFAKWLRTELFDSATAILNDSNFDSSLFRVQAIKRDLERHRKGEIDFSGKLFDVLQFHIWRQLDPRVIPN